MSSPHPLEEEAQTDSFRPSWNPWNDNPKPNFWTGMGYSEDYGYFAGAKNIAAMPGSAAAKGELLLSGAMHLGGNVDFAADEQGGLVGTESADQTQGAADAVEADAKARLKALRPDPSTTGLAVQTLHSLGEGATTMLAGAAVAGPVGAFSALSSTEGYSTYKDLIDQGVSGEVAARVASIRGITAGLGGVMPMVAGAGLATRLLTGAASNTAFGVVNRELDSTILRANGYGEMADQEQVFDRTQMLIDMTLGLGFGAVHHLTAEARPAFDKLQDEMQSDSQLRDAALTANLALRDRQSGPGVPITPGDANAHQAAQTRALINLQDGEHVNVAGTGVEESTVLPRGGEPNPELPVMFYQAIEESGLLEETAKRDELEQILNRRLEGTAEPGERAGIGRGADLTDDQRDIERRFSNEIGGNPEDAEARYNALPESKGGKVINTDTARELSSDYLKDRTNSAAVHEPASWLMKRLFAKRLTEAPKEGEEAQVLFMAGGTGAGKSTAIEHTLGPLEKKSQIVYDTNMNDFDSAMKKINQALAAKKHIKIVYTYRDPIEALREGALTRAMRQERETGSGRTVPVGDHVDTHIGSRDVIDRLQQHFAGDSRVKILALDNTRGRGQARSALLSEIPKFGKEAYNRLRGQALSTLEAEHAAGRISDAVYRGFAGKEAAGLSDRTGDQAGRSGSELEAGPALARALRQPESQRSGQRSDALSGLGPKLERSGGAPPLPGQSLLVGRVGRSGELVNRNAGNGRAIAEHLARLEDQDRPQPIRAGESDALFLHELTPHETMGDYQRANQGRIEGEHIGRQEGKNGAIAYSLPEPADFTSRQIARIPLDEVYSALKRETGHANFDESGTQIGGEFLDRFLNERAAKDAADSAKALVAGARGEGDSPAADAAQGALTERPGLTIQTPEGATVPARAELAAANENAARTEQEAPTMFKAAINCFMRQGT